MRKEEFEQKFAASTLKLFMAERQLPKMREKMRAWSSAILNSGDLFSKNRQATFDDILADVANTVSSDEFGVQDQGLQVWGVLRTYHKALVYFNHNAGNAYLWKLIEMMMKMAAGDLDILAADQAAAPGDNNTAKTEWAYYKAKYDDRIAKHKQWLRLRAAKN